LRSLFESPGGVVYSYVASGGLTFGGLATSRMSVAIAEESHGGASTSSGWHGSKWRYHPNTGLVAASRDAVAMVRGVTAKALLRTVSVSIGPDLVALEDEEFLELLLLADL